MSKAPAPCITPEFLAKLSEETDKLTVMPKSKLLRDVFEEGISKAGTNGAIKVKQKDLMEILKDLSVTYKHIKLNVALNYYITTYPAFKPIYDIEQMLIKNNQATESHKNKWFKEFYCYLRLKLENVPNLLELAKRDKEKRMSAKKVVPKEKKLQRVSANTAVVKKSVILDNSIATISATNHNYLRCS